MGHRDFCEIAIAEARDVRTAGRIATDPKALALFVGSLVDSDEVAIEATSNAVEITRTSSRTCGSWSSPPEGGTRQGTARKTDRIDAIAAVEEERSSCS